MYDPEIDLKIQQTIRTCIVKSPSKKYIESGVKQEYVEGQKEKE